MKQGGDERTNDNSGAWMNIRNRKYEISATRDQRVWKVMVANTMRPDT